MGKWTMASIENHGRSHYQRVGDGKCWGMLRGLVNRMSSTWFSSWPRGRTVLILAMAGKWRPDLESKNMKNLMPWRWKLIFNPHVLVFNRNLWHFPRFPMFLCWKVEHQPTQRSIVFFFNKTAPRCCLVQAFLEMIHDPQNRRGWIMMNVRYFRTKAVRKKTANRQYSALASGTLVLHLFCSIFLLPPSEPRLKAIFFCLKRSPYGTSII